MAELTRELAPLASLMFRNFSHCRMASTVLMASSTIRVGRQAAPESKSCSHRAQSCSSLHKGQKRDGRQGSEGSPLRGWQG